MKNKIIIISLIILGFMLTVLVGFYFVRQDKTPAGNQVKTESGAGENNQINIGQSQGKLVTDDFEVNIPAGWRQTAPAMGSSAIAVNADEYVDDPAAQKINFKSYFAVSYDTLQGKDMSEYVRIVKSGLQQTIPNVVFTKDQDMTINGKSAHAMEAELTQQGANFKILMVVVKGQEDDVWVMSFNTTKSSWDGYKEIFYNIADSFSLKK